MRSMVSSRRRTAAPSLGHGAAWSLSVAAVGIALIPGAAPWAAPLFALAVAQWARLAYGGKRPRARGPVAAAHAHDTDSMRSEALRKLIATASRTAGNDLRALRADLGQVRGLVHDAAVTLGDGFQRLSATMQRERPGAGQETVDGSEVLVRSLQFEDVARQLLEYCDHQVAGLESCADELAGLLCDAELLRQPAERESRLARACENYLEKSRHWAIHRQRHITQTSMLAGKVELF